MPANAEEQLLQLLRELRNDSRLALMSFLSSAQNEAGGLLVLRAPNKKRSFADAAYRSERWADFVGPTT